MKQIQREYKDYRNKESNAYKILTALKKVGKISNSTYDTTDYQLKNGLVVRVAYAPNCNMWNNGRVGDWIYLTCYKGIER